MTHDPNTSMGEDPELRALLDSIGLRSTAGPPSASQQILDRARAEQDLDAIVSSPVDRPPRHSPREGLGARRWRVRAAIVAGAVALACVAGVVAVVLPHSSTPSAAAGTPPMLSFSGVEPDADHPLTGRSAVTVLRGLADRVGDQPAASAALPVQRIQEYAWWAATDSDAAGKATASVLVPVKRTTYLLPDGRMRDVERRGTPLDRYGRVAGGGGSWGRVPSAGDETIKTGEPADYPATLPTDPARLLAVLAPARGCAADPGDCVLNALSNLNTTYVIDPAVGAALWRAAALAPGVTTLGTTTDRLGRKVVALTAPAPSSGEQTILLADPQTGVVLGSETVLTKPNGDFALVPPAVIAFTAIVAADRVRAPR